MSWPSPLFPKQVAQKHTTQEKSSIQINGKLLTSMPESYHVLKFILYNYCKISLSIPPYLLLCSPLCKNTLFCVAFWFSALPLSFPHLTWNFHTMGRIAAAGLFLFFFFKYILVFIDLQTNTQKMFKAVLQFVKVLFCSSSSNPLIF